MELYKQYIKEMYNRECMYFDRGFITYDAYDDGSIYIHSIYTTPEARNNRLASQMEQALIEKYNPSLITCYVDLTTKNPTLSASVIMAAGYKIVNSNGHSIVFEKRLK